MRLLKRISALFLVLTLLLALPVQPVLAKDPAQASAYDYNETDQESVHVTVTVTSDGIPLIGRDSDGTILAHVDVEVPWFPLELYRMQNFNRYPADANGTYTDKENLIHRPTALHLYIYLLERYCMGLPEEACGKGELQVGGIQASLYGPVMNMEGGTAYTPETEKVFAVSGGPQSLYMTDFWGHDQNLMYYRNHIYPLMREKVGSTCDYILLSDGDTIDVAMFTNWNFWKNGEFMCFEQDTYTCKAGETLNGKILKYDTQSVADGGTESFEQADGGKLEKYVVLNEKHELTKKTFASNADGTWSVTFDEPGTYYIIGLDKDRGTENAAVAPPNAKVVVEPAAMLGDVNQDGSVDLEDASMVREIANGIRTAEAEILKLADVNSDGQTDVLDAAILYGYAAGKLTELPGKLTE